MKTRPEGGRSPLKVNPGKAWAGDATVDLGSE